MPPSPALQATAPSPPAPTPSPAPGTVPPGFSYSDHPHFAPPRRTLPSDHPSHGEEGDVWVFGYGSLLWKVDFEHEEAVAGWVRGWRRVFYQGSIDHRGTHDYWGRVVTLLTPEQLRVLPNADTEEFEDADAATWGIAYRLPRNKERRDAVLHYLDWREKNGYECAVADMWSTRKEEPGEEPLVRGALVYVATPENPSFLGPEPVSVMAERIAKASGPSGPNAEYLFMVAGVVREAGVVDKDLFHLEAEVKALLAGKGTVTGENGAQ
ncbi:ChaC, cation transport regulator-like protein 2 [Hyaloraphidium curvatum]|nr:ChaC, cation transport regulator-like protein 2 [Hyaloraphidium curvatum]